MTDPIYGETVTAIRRTKGARNALGNDTLTTATTVSLTGAIFDPGGTTEQVDGRDQVVQTPRFLWVDTIPDLTAVDAIQRADSSVWEIIGNPLYFVNPYDDGDDTEVLQVNVERVTG